MDAGSWLETISEIAVSVTGFAGIVGALAGEKVRPANPEVWLPFWAMISSGLSLLLVLLFPFVPHQLGAPDQAIWVVSSALMIVVMLSNLAFFMPRIWRAQRQGSFPRIRSISIPLDVSGALIVASQFANVLGFTHAHSAGAFLVGLYLLMLISSLNFVFLLYVLSHAGVDPPAADRQIR